MLSHVAGGVDPDLVRGVRARGVGRGRAGRGAGVRGRLPARVLPPPQGDRLSAPATRRLYLLALYILYIVCHEFRSLYIYSVG